MQCHGKAVLNVRVNHCCGFEEVKESLQSFSSRKILVISTFLAEDGIDSLSCAGEERLSESDATRDSLL